MLLVECGFNRQWEQTRAHYIFLANVLIMPIHVWLLENGFQYLPLLIAEFSSHKIYMCNYINMIVVSCWKI